MTESQDIRATKKLGTSEFNFITYDGKKENGKWQIYETDNKNKTLFATDSTSNKISFDVTLTEDGFYEVG